MENPLRNRAKCLEYQLRHPKRILMNYARKRAKDRNRPFSLKETDFEIPEVCPLLGIPLVRNVGRLQDNSATLDEVVTGRGYVPGNVMVLSHKANTMKSNATINELKAFAEGILKTYASILSD